jgi:hypothetical protein
LIAIYELLCPPYVSDIHEAARKLAEREFGAGGTYDATTGGPFRESREIKATTQPYTRARINRIREMAQHIYSTCGRIPARFPAILLRIYAQVHHLEQAFYDQFFGPEAYLSTHAEHMQHLHPEQS